MGTAVQNFRRAGVAQYLTIAETIHGWITSGRYTAGNPIDTVDSLASQFGVAKGTVQEALKELSARGVIETSRGKRSIVTLKPQLRPISRGQNPSNQLLFGQDAHVQRELLCARAVTANEDLRALLGFGCPKDLVEFRSILHIDGEPSIQLLNYVPAASPGIHTELTGDALNQALITIINGSENAERRVSATIADLEISTHLQLSIGAPVLRYRSVLWSGDRQLDLYYEMYMRSGEREYVIGG